MADRTLGLLTNIKCEGAKSIKVIQEHDGDVILMIDGLWSQASATITTVEDLDILVKQLEEMRFKMKTRKKKYHENY